MNPRDGKRVQIETEISPPAISQQLRSIHRKSSKVARSLSRSPPSPSSPSSQKPNPPQKNLLMIDTIAQLEAVGMRHQCNMLRASELRLSVLQREPIVPAR